MRERAFTCQTYEFKRGSKGHVYVATGVVSSCCRYCLLSSISSCIASFGPAVMCLQGIVTDVVAVF